MPWQTRPIGLVPCEKKLTLRAPPHGNRSRASSRVGPDPGAAAFGAPPLPKSETRLGFIRQYAADSEVRLRRLKVEAEPWWEEPVDFFDTRRVRAWVLVRRVAHSSHHRGQLMAMLRMLGRQVHSNYGPTADTGGLMANSASVIYAYPDVEALLRGEAAGGQKAELPGPGDRAPTERP